MRLHLTFACITALLLYVTLLASRPDRFTYLHDVLPMAAKLAQSPYQPPSHLAPPELQQLSVDQLADIRWLNNYTLWQGTYPFQIKFWHLGAQYRRPVQIYTVNRKGPHLLSYSPKFFDFGNNHFAQPLPADLGFAGFRIHYPLNNPQTLDELASFLGGSYFRVISKDQAYGLSSRAVSVNTAVMGKNNQSEPEEMPDFTKFWIVEPSGLNATELQIYALVDSPSLTGAYQFTLYPGVATRVNVQATLFFRKSVKRLGLGQLTSMYLFGENSREGVNDNFHPEVHDSDGVLLNDEKGQWIWRPLQAQPCIREVDTPEENPRGFGLFQRDRDFQHYQDIEAKYQLRPSAWVEPTGNWGKGTLELIQLNSNDSNTDNVNLLWHPDENPQPGQQMSLSYTITFPTFDDRLPPLGYCTQTFVSTPPPGSLQPPKPTPTPTPAPTPTPTPTPTKSHNGRQNKLHEKSGPIQLVGPPAPRPTPPPPQVYKHVSPTLWGPPFPAFAEATRFQMDFTGGEISLPKDSKNITPDSIPIPIVSSDPPGHFTAVKVVPSVDINAWRVSFAVLPSPGAIELSCRLVVKGKPITETWAYTLYPPPPPAPTPTPRPSHR